MIFALINLQALGAGSLSEAGQGCVSSLSSSALPLESLPFAMVMNWKFSLVICFGIFVLKATGLLEGIGFLPAWIFAKR